MAARRQVADDRGLLQRLDVVVEIVDDHIDPGRRDVDVGHAVASIAVPRDHPKDRAAQRQGALTDAATLEHWCSSDTLRHAAAFAEQMIKRRS